MIISMFMILLQYSVESMAKNKINLEEYKTNFPNSRKIYKEINDIKIPYRAITISNSSHGSEEFYVYDTTGPYTEPDFNIDLNNGLPKTRNKWILERQENFASDKKFKNNLYKSSFFTKILNNDTSSRYFAQWSNQFDLIIEGVMSKKYFATLKYYKISDSQIKKMQKIASSDKRECTTDKGLPLTGAWEPDAYTWFDTGPRSIAKFGSGYQTKNFLKNEYFEFDKSISIDDIFDPGRSYTDKDNLEDFSLSKNKFYYTMPNGEVRYGFYSISAPHNGQSNELIKKWVENRLKFKCLRDSVN